MQKDTNLPQEIAEKPLSIKGIVARAEAEKLNVELLEAKEVSNEMRSAVVEAWTMIAKEIKTVFDAYIEAGFSENQSLFLCLERQKQLLYGVKQNG